MRRILSNMNSKDSSFRSSLPNAPYNCEPSFRLSAKWQKIHPCGSDVISELEHRSLGGRNETRTVNLENPKNPPEPSASEQKIRLATQLVTGEGQQAWKHFIIIVHWSHEVSVWIHSTIVRPNFNTNVFWVNFEDPWNENESECETSGQKKIIYCPIIS